MGAEGRGSPGATSWVVATPTTCHAESTPVRRSVSSSPTARSASLAAASTLITTADTDDRVVLAHSFKFAAALQHAHGGSAPVLIRIETRAGHGAGKPTTKRIEEMADQWAFLVKILGMETPEDR